MRKPGLSRVSESLGADHTGAAADLRELRSLTDAYTLPDWGCNTYRAMPAALEELEENTQRRRRRVEPLLIVP